MRRPEFRPGVNPVWRSRATPNRERRKQTDMNTQAQTFTESQQAVVASLRTKFEIDDDQIRFLNPEKPNEPWLSAEGLMSIARQTTAFRSISERFDSFIPELMQVVHCATVVDQEGRTFERTGVA